MSETPKQTRREFIRVCSAGGASLVLAAYAPLPGLWKDPEDPSAPFSPNAFLRVDASGNVTVTIPRSEMGQGVYTSLAMLVAEELDVDWNSVKVELAHADQKFGDQETGGSTSMRKSWGPLRLAGATARAMLVAAAAARWKVNPGTCTVKDGVVSDPSAGRKLSFGELARDAARLPVPADVKPKDPGEYRLLGRSLHRLDTPAKVRGAARYGIDQVLPGMLYATVIHSPSFGGALKTYDASRTKALRGVKDVVAIGTGVAVIAESTWLAFKGKELLTVDWESGPHAGVSSESIRQTMASKLREPGVDLTVVGKPPASGEGERSLEAVYEAPYLAHATLEPMNCLAHWKAGVVELWAPTQHPQGVRTAVARALGLDEEKVRVNVTFIGGGFGRRTQTDYGVEAALISRHTGTPVKLTWTREEDMRHDFYRPASIHHLSGRLDGHGAPLALTHHVITASIEEQLQGKPLEPRSYDFKGAALERAYTIPFMKLTGTVVDSPLPIGYWRSVYRSQNPFALESFIDEMAAAAGKDPYEFRRDMLPQDSRLRQVLTLAAEKADWYAPRAQGTGKGIACITAYDSYCASVAEVHFDTGGKLHVDRYVCAVDCGLAVNPGGMEAQMQSAVAFALSAALKERITVRNGGVVERSFNDFPILSFDEMPGVEVHIVRNTLPVGGLGELGIGVCAPALCNAIFAATGRRIRTLPVEL